MNNNEEKTFIYGNKILKDVNLPNLTTVGGDFSFGSENLGKLNFNIDKMSKEELDGLKDIIVNSGSKEEHIRRSK